MIRIVMHTAFALERMIKNEPLTFPEDEEITHQLENIYQKNGKNITSRRKKAETYLNKR